MLTRTGKWSLAALSLTTLCLVATPLTAHAQQDEANGTGLGSDTDNKIIKLDLENTDLYTAVKLLFAQVPKLNYTLDPSLRGITITAKLTQPFRIALESLLKASNQPLTYSRSEAGVYSIVPKVEETPDVVGTTPDTTDQQEQRPRYKKIRISALSSADIVALLGGRPIYSVITNPLLPYNAYPVRVAAVAAAVVAWAAAVDSVAVVVAWAVAVDWAASAAVVEAVWAVVAVALEGAAADAVASNPFSPDSRALPTCPLLFIRATGTLT